MMKKTIMKTSTYLTTTLLGILLVVATLRAQDRQVLDRIVAHIGGEIITLSELELQTAQIALQNKLNPADTSLKRRVLDMIVVDKLILAKAQIDSVSVSEDEVTQALDRQLSYLEQNYGSRERLEQAAGMSISKMKREYREDIRNRMMVEKMKEMKFGEMFVSRREVEEFFNAYKDSLPQVPEQVELRQIVLYPKVTDQYKTESRQKAEAILDSVRRGADFAALAKKFSEDAGSAKNGGDLGLVRRGIFVKEFEEAAYALEPGQISGIVETQFGFHIIKLLEKKGEAIRPQHILVRVAKTGASDSLVINALRSIRERLTAGEKFEELAEKYSEDVDTKSFGGSIGIVEVPRLSEEMHLATQSLKDGELSETVKLKIGNDYAYSIVQLQRRIHPHSMNLKEDYDRIEQISKTVKRNKQIAEWVESIKRSIYYEITL